LWTISPNFGKLILEQSDTSVAIFNPFGFREDYGGKDMIPIEEQVEIRNRWPDRSIMLGGGLTPNQAIRPPSLSHQRRRRPAPFLDARGYRGNLSIRVGAGVFRVWDQPIDLPPLDLIGRPRSLISGLDPRAGARTRRGSGSVGAFTRLPTRSRPRSASRHWLFLWLI
jgi:hypothetical protein